MHFAVSFLLGSTDRRNGRIVVSQFEARRFEQGPPPGKGNIIDV